MKVVNNIIIVIVIVLLPVSCKKYPENVLLVVPPEMALKQLSGAKLKIFKINGYDSTIVLERKWRNVKDRVFEYNPYLAPRSSSFYSNYTWDCSNCGIGIIGRIQLYENQKTLAGSSPFNIYGIEKWSILKLNTKELKIMTNKNNYTYEMVFSK